MVVYIIKKLIACPVTYLGALTLCLAMIFSIESDHDSMPAYIFDYVFATGFPSQLLPVAVVLPIAYIRHAIQTSSAWQFPLLHSTPLRYTLGGLAAAFASGAFVMLLSAGGFHLYVVLFLKGPISYDYTLFDHIYFYTHFSNRVGYLIRIGFQVVTSGMYAILAYGVSGLSSNQYLCAAFPFAFKIAVSVFAGAAAAALPAKYRVISVLDPGQLNNYGYYTSAAKDGGLSYVALYVLIVALLSGGGFYLRLKRRLRDG